MDLFTLSAVKNSSTVIKGIENSAITTNLQHIIHGGSGAVDNTFIGIGSATPEFSFDTAAIKTALANLGGISGIAMSSTQFWLQKMADGGTRASGNNHTKVTAAAGTIIPVTLRIPKPPGHVTLSYRAVPKSANGSASPLVIAAAQALEAAQNLNTEIYVMGGASINGTALDGIDDITIDFGLELEILHSGGHIYPTFVGIKHRTPKITISTCDAAKFATWTELGVAQGSTDSTITISDQLMGGVRGASPITFAVDEGHIGFESLSASHPEKYGGSAVILPVSDDVNAVIAISGLT